MIRCVVIKYLLFDLDNTLYSSSWGLEEDVSRRIWEFSAAFLGISPQEARRQRMTMVQQYGTCLEWLIGEKGFTDCETYLAAVHPQGEADSLPPDEALRAFLAGIPIPKAILTNAPREHADLILGKLGVSDLFTHVFDVRQCDYRGKPRRDVFENALANLGVNADEVLFIDDNPTYVEGFIAIGGKALLFDENDIHHNCPVPRIRELKELMRHI